MENITVETIKTKLKFEKSAKTKLWVGFVSINPKNGYIRGVRSSSEMPKKICVIRKNSELASQIQPGVLYDVEMVPMKNKKVGYVVEKAEPHVFEARIESCVIHNAVYWVKVKFGNKVIIYNPLDGINDNMRTIKGCIEALSTRKDIANLPDVISQFTQTANVVLTDFKNDGYYVPEKN